MQLFATLGAIALGSLSLGSCHYAENLAASGPIIAANVPQGPVSQRGEAVVGPVYFVEQAGVDALCGGKEQIIACAIIGGGPMVLPNPCQARFAGESFAAVACHEKSHSLGWTHER